MSTPQKKKKKGKKREKYNIGGGGDDQQKKKKTKTGTTCRERKINHQTDNRQVDRRRRELDQQSDRSTATES